MVDAVRKAFGIRRVGHAGTLDPAASGLLVTAVGGATRLLAYVQELPKTYDATGVLGIRTTTLDAAGEITSREEVHVTEDDIRAAAAGLVGEIWQVPPAHSAVKVGGERAYRKARRGESPDPQPRTVTVYAFDVLRTSASAFDARVTCSSGTYVRSLVADVGEKLGCGAHVVHLRRTAIGHLDVRDATRPDEVSVSSIQRVEDALKHYFRVDVDAPAAGRARNGRPIEAAGTPDGRTVVCGPDGAVGVFEAKAGVLRPLTVLGD
jgi:tRNA pseudouridine55 synthase